MEETLHTQRNKLRQMRELRGWTQKDVADKLALPDTRTLRRWEHGDIVPSLRYRARLCDIFEMSPQELGLLSTNHWRLTENVEPSLEQHDAPDVPEAVIASGLQLLIPLNTLSTSTDDWNRQRLLEKVYTFWIKHVLEQSLHGSVYIPLDLREQPDAVSSPWKQVIELSPQSQPPHTSTIQVYDAACGELLILGEPGAGKTTLLLELARELLLRAAGNDHHPMPVVLNLSSWPLGKLPLADWLVEELSSKYHVPRRVGRVWVDNDRILPLLDGLDEVSPALRDGCVEAINLYRQGHGLLPIVVCSRKEEYLNLTTRLSLQEAVCIQPLTRQRVDAYLTDKEGHLEALRLAIHDDRELQQLVTTPLMLSVLTLAYRDRSVETLKGLGSIEVKRRHVFAIYVERMLKRRNGGNCYPVQESIHWLRYLARQMKQRDHTEFYLERMQLDWLPSRRLQQVCYGLFAGLWAGGVSGVLVGLIARSLGEHSIESLIITPWVAIVFGMIAGVVASLLEKALFHPMKKILAGVLAVGIAGGATVWLSNAFPVFNSLQYGAVVGLISVLVLLLLSVKDATIRPAELVNWSWTRVWKNACSSSSMVIVLIWVSSELIGGIIGWFDPDMRMGIVVVLLFGLLSFLLAAMLSGFSSEMLDEHLIVKPNQGIWRSAYYALRTGLLAASLNGLALTIVGVLIEKFFPGLVVAPNFVVCGELAFSLVLGLIIGMHKGGEACLKHLLLRLMLSIERCIPWNYPRFLNYAVEHILLYKIGGGYIFVHRWLLDYFAEM